MVATVNRDELNAKIDRGERFKLVETLPEPAFQKAHLPGAINLPPDRLRELAPQAARQGRGDHCLLLQPDLKRLREGRP